MSRTYADAITALNTLQSNFAVVDAIRKSGRKMNEQAIPEMRDWCCAIGYEPSDFNKLNTIHIAGTKGKGSTAAFVYSILNKHVGYGECANPRHIGLYTSPHLRFVRERIQVDQSPLSEEKFAQYFFETWDRLEVSAREAGKDPSTSAKPVYFRFLTLMAFHTFMRENVSCAVIECGVGGEYDSTNILEKPIVTGITSLGIDHQGMLGNTIEEIAWHKAGIMKNGAKCFVNAEQPAEALEVLQQRATEMNVELEVTSMLDGFRDGKYKLGLEGGFQQKNACLAWYLAREWLLKMDYNSCDTLSDLAKPDTKAEKGWADVQLSGRCETRQEPGILWCIDGGHTLESIRVGGQWYAEKLRTDRGDSKADPMRVLIFNQQTRDAQALARALHDTISATMDDKEPFDHVIFCTNKTFSEDGFRSDLVNVNISDNDVDALRVQKDLAKGWPSPEGVKSHVATSIEEAYLFVKDLAKDHEVTALVTGSLHLVGGFLVVLESHPASNGR